jgi:hypothetical protein
MFEKRMEPLVRAAFLKRRVGYTRTVTRVLSSHYPTSLPPESPNKRIVSDDSLSRKKEEGGKIVYCERKGNIRVDVRARGRAKRSAPRKAAACAPGGTEGQ